VLLLIGILALHVAVKLCRPNARRNSVANILTLVARLREEDPPLNYLSENESVSIGKFLEFEVVRWNGKLRAVPSEALNLPGRRVTSSFLYRGQNIRHRPCVASLFRGISQEGEQLQGRLLLSRVRVAELELILRDHPFTHVASKHGFSVDYAGLAQHYGIPTALVDLTSNIEVAAFFAVAHWSKERAWWIPMETGIGVLYRVHWINTGPGYSKFFDPVGHGPGLRPSRQHAWTHRPRVGVDFESIPIVETLEFQHDRTASMKIMAAFDNGYHLYPKDCLATLVKKVRDLPFVTMKAIRHAALQDGQPEDQVDILSERAALLLSKVAGLDIIDAHELALEPADVRRAQQQSSALDERLSRMRTGIRIIRTEK
jgi:hypothetical protein